MNFLCIEAALARNIWGDISKDRKGYLVYLATWTICYLETEGKDGKIRLSSTCERTAQVEILRERGAKRYICPPLSWRLSQDSVGYAIPVLLVPSCESTATAPLTYT